VQLSTQWLATKRHMLLLLCLLLERLLHSSAAGIDISCQRPF
jgi:hypothetical protein